MWTMSLGSSYPRQEIYSGPEYLPNYWPLGPTLAMNNRPTPAMQKGGASSVNERVSLMTDGYNSDPAPEDVPHMRMGPPSEWDGESPERVVTYGDPDVAESLTRHINTTFPGEDGTALFTTVHPYDKTVAIYTQPGQRGVPAWQNPEFGPDHRDLVRWQQPAYGAPSLQENILPTRPPVGEVDYHFNTLTSDSAMTSGAYAPDYPDDTYTGPDYNAY